MTRYFGNKKAVDSVTMSVPRGSIFAFLGRVTDTLIPAVALPLSLLITFLAMWALNYSINNLTADYNTKIPLWNASLSRQVLKFNRGEFKFAVKDLLDKNIRVNRSSNQNYIEDTRTNSLRRFFLLSFTYSLNKTGLNSSGSGPGMKMMMR